MTKHLRAWLLAGTVMFSGKLFADGSQTLPATEALPDAQTTLETTVVPAADLDDTHWIDSSHEYATNRAQDLAQWMDDFFGAPVRDAERADSFARAIFLDDWDERDGHDPKVRLRGQISLPKVSERVDLVFSGEESEQTLTEEERSEENDVGVRFNFRDSRRTRLDATLSLRSGPAVLPGVRFRYQQPITDNSWARFTQRLQYHSEDGYRSLTNFDANRILDDKTLLRWNARIRYREDKEFWDYNTGITYRRWLDDHEQFPSAIEYFVAVSGRDEPQNFETNYRVGFLYRKQFFRQFLFYEFEPSYNWRRDLYEEKREGVLGIVLRLEVMLDRDLVGGH
ncbi:MAG: hypothetical protein NWQ45_14315 [Congregibacter sp.]|nr:hypothetical protein [Congregibacter sp.]